MSVQEFDGYDFSISLFSLMTPSLANKGSSFHFATFKRTMTATTAFAMIRANITMMKMMTMTPTRAKERPLHRFFFILIPHISLDTQFGQEMHLGDRSFICWQCK